MKESWLIPPRVKYTTLVISKRKVPGVEVMSTKIDKVIVMKDETTVHVILEGRKCPACKYAVPGNKKPDEECGDIIIKVTKHAFYYTCTKCDFESYTEHDDILQHWEDFT